MQNTHTHGSAVCLCFITGISECWDGDESECALGLIPHLLSFHPAPPFVSPPATLLTLCSDYKPHPSPLPPSPLCQWKIPPAQSHHIKAKPNSGCSAQSGGAALRGSEPNRCNFDGSDTCSALLWYDQLVTMVNECRLSPSDIKIQLLSAHPLWKSAFTKNCFQPFLVAMLVSLPLDADIVWEIFC